MTSVGNWKFSLGNATDAADGTYYVVAVWDAKKRDYVDDPSAGVFRSGTDAQLAGARKMGTRLVRYTVSDGFVTTRRGLT